MIRYPDQPHNVPMLPDRYGNTYYIAHDYIYRDDKIFLHVKKGFRYDGASVPRWAWTISGLRPDGVLRAAALVHDCLYLSNGWSVKNETDPFKLEIFEFYLSRKQCDKLFRKILLECGVGKFRSWLAYKAVRIGGRFYREF